MSDDNKGCPWLELEQPPFRTLKVYALDPSAGNYIGNIMTMKVKWEEGLKPGPFGSKIAVIDYDAANKCYYPPVDLNDSRVLARGGLDPSESDPRFHQQMVYAVATETIERFEAALGRNIHWRRADRPRTKDGVDPEVTWRKTDDIWTLSLFPHAMIQANAYYSPEVKGILFGYFKAEKRNQGNNLPGQRVFTCLSHDIIAHEVTHAILDGLRTYFTEATNPDVLAFHEGFADLAALFAHFSHKEALLDTIQKTGGRLYQFELKPNIPPTESDEQKEDDPDEDDEDEDTQGEEDTDETEEESAEEESEEDEEAKKKLEESVLADQQKRRNPLIDLAKQFGEASGMNRGLRNALGVKANSNAINTRIDDVHFRGSILVAAVFDAYFTIYMKRTADLYRIYHAGGGRTVPDELPGPLARMLAEQASVTAAEFFQLCARAIDYCPPVDITYGDFLRALITVNLDLKAEDGRAVRDALMESFRARGIYPETASFFSEDALCWPRVPKWPKQPEPPLPPVVPAAEALPPVKALIKNPKTGEFPLDPKTGKPVPTKLVFGNPNGLTKNEKDINGAVLRQYAEENAARLGFDADPSLAAEFKPYAPSFHPVFRIAPDGSLRTDMVVELVQTRRVPFDVELPDAGSFPFRAGVTLIISAPDIEFGVEGDPEVRFAIGKGFDEKRLANQRQYNLAMGLANGDTEDPNHFQADFGLLHEGLM
jgi:hypothetical protein